MAAPRRGRRHALAIADIPLLYRNRARRRLRPRHRRSRARPRRQLARLRAARRARPKTTRRRRIAAQMPHRGKAQRADHVIRTDGTFEDTRSAGRTQVRRRTARRAAVSAAVSVFFSSIAIVSGPTPAGHRRQRAGDLRDTRDGRRRPRSIRVCSKSARRGDAAPKRRRTTARGRSPRLMPTSTTVAPGLTNARRHERRDGRSRPPGCRPSPPRPRGPASSSGRSSPSRPAAAAASPSASRRSRCGRSRRRARRPSRCRSASSSSMTPDGVHGVEAARGPARAGRRSPGGSRPRPWPDRSRRTPAARPPRPIAAGSGDCTRIAVVHGARVQPRDERQQLVERRRGGQALQVRPQPGLGAAAHLVPDVDLRRRIVADEHDAEARRPSGPRRERVHARAAPPRGSAPRSRGRRGWRALTVRPAAGWPAAAFELAEAASDWPSTTRSRRPS